MRRFRGGVDPVEGDSIRYYRQGAGQIRFDIIAKAPVDTPFDQLLVMMQTLLTERFQLKLHREQRELTHYELVVGKNGSKLRESKVDVEATRGSVRTDGITSNRMDMHQLAVLMSRMTRTPVLDKTGLTGVYEFKLNGLRRKG